MTGSPANSSKSLARAKLAAYEKDNFGSPSYLYFESNDRAQQTSAFGTDPFPFGVKQNRKMLEMLFRNSHAEGLTQKLATIEEVFFPALLNS